MKLKEFEAKKLLDNVGVLISNGQLISNPNEIQEFNEEKVFKVQTLSGGRGKAGGILIIKDSMEAKGLVNKFLNKEFLGELVNEILIDEKVSIDKELYLGIMFDTSKKVPVVIFSDEGGVDIEELKKNNPEKIVIKEINVLDGVGDELINYVISKFDLDISFSLKLNEIIKKVYACFTKFDCKMIEINPLVITPNKNLVAVDAVIVLDDNANYRREINFTERTGLRVATKRELAARKIDEEDHRGVAGKTYLDLGGDIGILASGGGASITLMDALLKFGGKAANYTEYSGNPPPEKVEKLTRVVLDKKNLSGLLVAGVIANFTNIAETMKGLIKALGDLRPDYPIVIRRAGPNDQEAKELLMQAKKDYNLDLHYFDENTPLTKAAEIMVKLSEQYKQKN